MKMKLVKPSDRIIRARGALLAAISAAAQDLSSEETRMTPQQGADLITDNIKKGNQDAFKRMVSAPVQGSA